MRSVRVLDGPKARSAARPRSTSPVAWPDPVMASVPTDSRLSRTVSGPAKPRVTRPSSARGRSGSSQARSACDRTHRVSSAETNGEIAELRRSRKVEDHGLGADPHEAHVRQRMSAGVRLLGQLDEGPIEEVEAGLTSRIPGGPLNLLGAGAGSRHPLPRATVTLELAPAPHQLGTHPGQEEGGGRPAGRQRDRGAACCRGVADRLGVRCRWGGTSTTTRRGAGRGRSGPGRCGAARRRVRLRVRREALARSVLAGDGRSHRPTIQGRQPRRRHPPAPQRVLPGRARPWATPGPTAPCRSATSEACVRGVAAWCSRRPIRLGVGRRGRDPGDLQDPARQDQVRVRQTSPIGLQVALVGLGDLRVPRGVAQLVAGDLPEGVAADHPMALGSCCIDRGVGRKRQRPAGVDAAIVAERSTVGLPDALVQLDDLDVALAGSQVLLGEQPEGVVTLGRDGGGSGLARRLVERLATWRERQTARGVPRCRSDRPRRMPAQRRLRHPTQRTPWTRRPHPMAGPPAAGLSATTTAATRTAATRCGTAIPGSVGVGTRRTAAHVSNPTLSTITAQATHATATIASRSSRPSSARPHAAGDSAPRSRGSADVRATSTKGTATTSTASAPSAASARRTPRGPSSRWSVWAVMDGLLSRSGRGPPRRGRGP